MRAAVDILIIIFRKSINGLSPFLSKNAKYAPASEQGGFSVLYYCKTKRLWILDHIRQRSPTEFTALSLIHPHISKYVK